MIRIIKPVSSLILITAFAMSLFVPLSKAQNDTGPGVVVSPNVQEVSVVTPGLTKQLSISIKNIYSNSVTGSLFFYDFNPSIDGSPKIKAENDYNLQHGLSKYMSGANTITIPGNITKNYDFQINLPNNLEPKSYYGIVLFSYNSPDTSDKIGTGVASIVLVNVGSPSYKASVEEINIEQSDFSSEVSTATVAVTIRNEGQYYFKPDVVMEILNSDKEVIEELKPEDVGNILPQSSRLFRAKWQGKVDKSLPYYVRAKLSLPSGENIKSDTTNFYKPPSQSAVDNTAVKSSQKLTNTRKNKISQNLVVFTSLVVVFIILIIASVTILLKRKRKASNAGNTHQDYTNISQVVNNVNENENSENINKPNI